MFQCGAVEPLDAPPGDRVPLVAATVSWLLGAGLFAAPPDIEVVDAGAMLPEAGADEDMAPLDGAILPPAGAMLPLAGAIAPELAGAMAEVFEALSVADIAPPVVAGGVSSAGLLQALTDRAATPAATIIRVFMDFSQRRPPGPEWPAFSVHTIVSQSERA